MKLGMNMLLWSTDVSGPEYDSTFAMLKDAGFDGVEIPIFDREVDKYARARASGSTSSGLDALAVTARTADDEPDQQPIPGTRAGLAATKASLDCVRGPRRDAHLRPDRGAARRLHRRARRPPRSASASVASLRAAAEYAADPRRDDRRRVPEPLRDVPHELRRGRCRARARGRPPELPADVRHVPRAHRGEGSTRGAAGMRRRARPLPRRRRTTAGRPAAARSTGTRPSPGSRRSATTAGSSIEAFGDSLARARRRDQDLAANVRRARSSWRATAPRSCGLACSSSWRDRGAPARACDGRRPCRDRRRDRRELRPGELRRAAPTGSWR